MIPNAGSVSNGILGVVGDLSEMERSVDLHSQTALVLLSSFAFLVPCFAAWRMKRVWHSFLFGMLTVVCASFHYCSAEGSQRMEVHPSNMRCSATVTHLLSHAFFLWVYFCFLQMAFLVLGPEDPHMQWLSLQAIPGNPSCSMPQHAPFDAVVTARVIPLTVLSIFHLFHASWDTEEIHWRSLLFNELLLLACCTAFWLSPSRQYRSADVLIRFKYWHRLLHHGLIPAMMLFWIFCIMGFADFQALHFMWHVVVAFFAVSMLRTVLLGESTSTSAKVFDVSAHNPNVAHVLLGSVALVVLPTAIIGASFDWCSSGQGQWPTISMATQCQPGGYFVAIVSVPAFVGVASVIWLIESTAAVKTSWLQMHSTKGWDDQERGDHGPYSPQQLALGRKLGCVLGYAAAFFALTGALIMRGNPLQNVLSLFCSIMSIGLMLIAMALTVLSSDPSTRSYRFKHRLTMLVCVPMMVVYMMLILADQCLPNQFSFSHTTYAIVEYIVVLLVSLWPLTWVADVQDAWQRNSSGSFAWPSTTWRFGELK